MTDHIKTIQKHKAVFSCKSESNVNKCVELADLFLQEHPEILYWTEPNDSKGGLFYLYKDGIYKAKSTFEIENLLMKFVPKDDRVYIPQTLSNGKFNETMTIIKRRRFFYRDMFNQEHIINFKNGLLDTITGQLLPHTMDIISTVQLPYGYDKDATCPVFEKFVYESLEGNQKKIDILQEFVGYCLTKDTNFEKALFIVGEAGTGKSTVLDAIEAILGEENCSSIRLDMLGDSRFTGNLMDKYVNIANEIPQNIENYEEALKTIVSGQKITVNTKFIPTYDAKPFCKLIFAANDLPRINDSSNAIFRRLLLLDFNNIVEKNNIDVHLGKKIRQELPGIFNWAYKGLLRLRENDKFSESDDMKNQLEELKLLNNSIYYFVHENYEVTQNRADYIEADELYEVYKVFCGKIGAKGIYKRNVFGKEMNKVFIKKLFIDRITIGGIQKRIWRCLRKKGIYSNITEVSSTSDSSDTSEGEQITWQD